MKRRTFGSLLGLGLLAGCATQVSLPDKSLENVNQEATTPNQQGTPMPARQESTPERTPVSAEDPVESEDSNEGEESPEEPVVEPVGELSEESVEDASAGSEDDSLSPAEQYGLERLTHADQKFDSVIEAFTGGSGLELTDVTAMSTGFLNAERDITQALAGAQKGYIRARKSVANDAQRLRAEQMVRCWQFFRQLTETQLLVVEGYTRLSAAQSHFETDKYESATIEIDQLMTAQSRASNRYQELLRTSSPSDSGALSSLTEDGYVAKIGQLDADISLYADLEVTLHDFANGVKFLRRAKSWIYTEDRHVRLGKDAAENARTEIRSAKRALDKIRRQTKDKTSLTPVLSSLGTLADSKLDEAEAILDQ